MRAGLGGVVLFGTPPSDLRTRLARLRTAGTVVPLVSSDEEGGQVQRLRTLLGRLPSAEEMGRTRTPAQVRALAASYGAGMRRLGVDVDLAPVADLSVRGKYMEQTDRAFSASPQLAGDYATAFATGLRSAGVAPVVKHWPGHGSADNTHDRAATTPPLSTLEKRDLVAFGTVIKAGGVAGVMVGHLQVPGLTEPGTPATLSPAAYRYLRRSTGPRPRPDDRLAVDGGDPRRRRADPGPGRRARPACGRRRGARRPGRRAPPDRRRRGRGARGRPLRAVRGGRVGPPGAGRQGGAQRTGADARRCRPPAPPAPR